MFWARIKSVLARSSATVLIVGAAALGAGAIRSHAAGTSSVSLVSNGSSGDWPAWRGSDNSGAVDSGNELVDSLGEAKLAWKIDPVGLSGCMYPGGVPGEGYCDPKSATDYFPLLEKIPRTNPPKVSGDVLKATEDDLKGAIWAVDPATIVPKVKPPKDKPPEVIPTIDE